MQDSEDLEKSLVIQDDMSGLVIYHAFELYIPWLFKAMATTTNCITQLNLRIASILAKLNKSGCKTDNLETLKVHVKTSA